MSARLKEDHPQVSLRQLCRMFSVSRSWYCGKPSTEQKARKDLDLRDAIARIVCWSSSTTATAGSPPSFTGEVVR